MANKSPDSSNDALSDWQESIFADNLIDPPTKPPARPKPLPTPATIPHPPPIKPSINPPPRTTAPRPINKKTPPIAYPRWWWIPIVRWMSAPLRWGGFALHRLLMQLFATLPALAPLAQGYLGSLSTIRRLWAKLWFLIGYMYGRMRSNGYDGFWFHSKIFWDTLMIEWRRTLSFFLSIVVGGIIIGSATTALVVALIWQDLPSIDKITRYEPVLPLQVQSAEGVVLGEIGSEHRTFTSFDKFPKHLVQALIAAEDQRFFSHVGFDPIGIARAMLSALKSGSARSGASTITQQLALNFYFKRGDGLFEKIDRKVREILLSIKLERELTKEKILEVYMNQIYLGERSFGFTSAARTYFNKDIGAITIGEAAILVGLPKFPSVNPLTNPKRVIERREYTLRRMFEDGYISAEERDNAAKEPLLQYGNRKKRPAFYESNHVVEMARQYLVDLLRAQGAENPEEMAYSKGFRIKTTIRADWQAKAQAAISKGLIRFELDHGFRAPEAKINFSNTDEKMRIREAEDKFDELPTDPYLMLAVLLKSQGDHLDFYLQNGERLTLNINKNAWLKKFTALPAQDKNALSEGAIVRVFQEEIKNPKDGKITKQMNLTQLPKVEGALVSIDPNDGKVLSLIGGYAYKLNQFNHVTQAWRQPGSTFKPFIYSAGIDRGIGAGDIFEDKPVIFEIPGSKNWEPKNYDNTYDGAMSVRHAIAISKNTIAAQILAQVGVDYVHQYLDRFGFDIRKVPPVMSIALGSGEVTPMQMATAYGVFANGGYRVTPWIIEEVRDDSGKIYYQYPQEPMKKPENLVLDPRNAYIVTSLLKGVVQNGTAASAGRAFQRDDLAGKTGTTNEYVDAWFCGYQPHLVSIVWVGYDQPQKLGRGATGGKIALPIWIDFMKTPLASLPSATMEVPADIGSFNGDLILKEFEKSSSSPSESTPWENWGVDPHHDYESEEQPHIPGGQSQPDRPALPPIRFF